MKNTTNIIGYIAALAAMVAAVFKINHFPGAGEGLMLTACFLSIYYPIFIIDKMREKTEGRILPLHLVAAFSASVVNLGVAFKIWHLNGAGILLTLGIAAFALVFIPMLLNRRLKEEGADQVMNGAGALGLSTFALGMLFKLQHWPGAAVLLAAGPAFLFLVYFPKYMMSPAISSEVKRNHLRTSFFVIIIGILCTLYFMKAIEIHAMDKVPAPTAQLLNN